MNASNSAWWRSAVIYQVYPRSFRDTNGDGVGDLPGVIAELPRLASLGVDALWLSPFMPSPQIDAGYDVSDYVGVDPLFGSQADAQKLIDRAHDHGLRVIIDLVPSHSSWEHAWFRSALAAGPGSPERGRYHFRDGRGPGGAFPPNNWPSLFGGPAWTRVDSLPPALLGDAGLPDAAVPGEGADAPSGMSKDTAQWYLHLFDASQPDLNWDSPLVRRGFEDILRTWLNRGADGFRIDVAHGMVKAEGLPDAPVGDDGVVGPVPAWGREGVHQIFREWRGVLAEFGDDRVLCAEAWVEPLANMAKWVRPDEMHQAFNFPFLRAPWEAGALRRVIDESLAAFGSVGAPSTWVLSNHDVVRHATRLSMPVLPHGDGVGPASPDLPTDREAALRRARAATTLMLALPGSAYLYQGEELGLPEVIDLPDDARQDPTWERSGRTRYGRDGCRIPLPWTVEGASAGFSTSDVGAGGEPGADSGRSWLPQPEGWGGFARQAQEGVPGSTLELYKQLLRIRAERGLGDASLSWLPSQENVLSARCGSVVAHANLGGEAVELPGHDRVLVASSPGALDASGRLLPDAAVWLEDLSAALSPAASRP